MDRKLKERITGATILVLIAVIVVPWVLDGEVAESTVETRIDLPAPGTTIVITDRDARDQPVMPSLPQAPAATPPPNQPQPEVSVQTRTPPKPVTRIEPEPMPAAESIEAPPATEVAAVSTPRPKTTPPPEPRAEPTPEPTPKPEPMRALDPTSGWAVQVGSFSSQANANKLTAKLVDLQYKAFVSRKSVNGRVWYRVRIGPKATRAEAIELSQRLKRDSQAVAIVPHPG